MLIALYLMDYLVLLHVQFPGMGGGEEIETKIHQKI